MRKLYLEYPFEQNFTKVSPIELIVLVSNIAKKHSFTHAKLYQVSRLSQQIIQALSSLYTYMILATSHHNARPSYRLARQTT